MSLAKRKQRIQKALTALQWEQQGAYEVLRHKGCWVCGSLHGLKTSRASEGIRCKQCFDAGKTNPDVEEYQRLHAELDRLNQGNG